MASIVKRAASTPPTMDQVGLLGEVKVATAVWFSGMETAEEAAPATPDGPVITGPGRSRTVTVTVWVAVVPFESVARACST